jgi:signal peptidase I
VTGTAQARRPAVGPAVLVGSLVAVVVALWLVAEPMRVSSGSMSPTYDKGDQVLVQKLGPRSTSPRTGDVVAFREPGVGALMIKRVVAQAGQSVGVEDGVLVVAGRPVTESYVDFGSVDSTYFGPVRVPAGSVFVLGDARAGSVDSRTFGAVPTRDIVGRVVLRLW